jgi:hypothetical protein
MVLSSAGTHGHVATPPRSALEGMSAPVPARVPYPTYGGEHINDVDYSENSPSEEGSATLESPAKSGADQEKPGGNGKEEAEPGATTNIGAGTIKRNNAVLTQAIVLDLAVT